MKRDIISVINNDGNNENIELCLFLNLHSSKRGCVIYKKLDSTLPEYYAAHYDVNDLEHSRFDYSFTEDEKEELTTIVKELVEV